MFRRLPDLESDTVVVSIDGQECRARAGDSVAAALLASGVMVTRRTPVSGASRAPYCMMGVCFECLVTIDGLGNRQACLIPVRAGMRIETASAGQEAEP